MQNNNTRSQLELLTELAALRQHVAELETVIAEYEQDVSAYRAEIARYWMLLHAASEGVVIHEDSIILDVNEAFCRITGYDPDEVIGRSAIELVTPESQAQVYESMQLGYDEPYEVTGIRRDGSTFPVELIGRVIEQGGRSLRVVTVRDITARQEAEVQRRESEARYRMLAENISDVIWTLNLQGQFTYVSPSVKRLRGYTVEEAMQQSLAEALAPESLKVIQEKLHRVLTGDDRDGHHLYELEQPCKDGSTVWTEVTTSLIEDDNGTITGILGVSRDITERRRIQEELAHERNLLRILIDNLPESIYVKDTQSRFLVVNADLLQRYGVEQAEGLIGKTDADFLDPELAEDLRREEAQLIVSGGEVYREFKIDQGPAGVAWMAVTKLPLRDSSGRVIGIVGINRDITASRQAERDRVALEVERAQLAILRRFVDDVSHDLRTPLTTMRLSLNILQRHPSEEMYERHLGILEAQTVHLTRLMEDVLSLANLDSETTIELHRFDLRDLVQEVIELHRPLVNEKSHDLRVEMGSGAIRLIMNRGHLTRVLSGLVVNAINYTPEGGTLTVRVESQGQKAMIAVQDTGIGISEEDLPYIFERFYRADRARSTDKGGLGLGLYIAREIIQSYGGRIEVDSTPGVGSTFRVYIPLLD